VIGTSLLLVTYNHALDYCWKCKHLIPLAWQQRQGAAYLEGISLRTLDISVGVRYKFRTQWPHGLRHEPSSPAGTLGSWVRIPLEAWISLCV
jgi:hypothetical protein